MGYISFCDWCERQLRKREYHYIQFHFKNYKIDEDICDECNKKAMELRDRLRGHVPVKSKIWRLFR